MKRQKISVVISAFNEESKIAECLKSVQWVDEIIVIDNASTDKTSDIAKKHSAKIHKVPNNLMLNVNKNFGFKKAAGPWILSLDADERVLPELQKEIEKVLQSDQVQIKGYWIPRKNIIFGKWIQNSIWWPDYQLRLFQKGYGKFQEAHVHEMLEVQGDTIKLDSPMLHENYQTISQYIYKMDKIYTDNEAENIIRSGKLLHWFDALKYPVNDFLKTFFAQKGYKDGLHGLILSMLQAMYALLVFAKVWEKQGFKEYNSPHFLKEVYNHQKVLGQEINYWFMTSFMHESKSVIKKTIYKVKRKISR